jgi:PAS domain S-box-containing protein
VRIDPPGPSGHDPVAGPDETEDALGLESLERRLRHLLERLSRGENADALLREALGELSVSVEAVRTADRELRRQNESLREGRDQLEGQRRRYADLFEFAPEAYLATDLDGTIEEANSAAGLLLATPPAALKGTALTHHVAEEAAAAFRGALAAVPQQGWRPGFELELQRRDATRVVVDVTVRAVPDADGRPVSLRWQLREATGRKRAEAELRAASVELEHRVLERTAQLEAASSHQAELARRERDARYEADVARGELTFLSEASAMLASSLDPDATLGTVASLAVPTFADWCLVDLLEPDGTIRQSAVAHAEASKEELARTLRRRYPPGRDHAIWRVIETGRTDLRPVITDGELAARARNDEHLAMLREVGIRSHIVVPLIARGQTLGAISLVYGHSGRRYGPGDVALAEELTRRCALALDNARLFRRAQEAFALLDAVFATAPIGMAFLDPDLHYVRVNDALAAMSGLPAEEHLGRRPSEVVSGIEGAEPLLRRVLESGEALTEEGVSGRTPAAPGEDRDWVVSAYPVTGADGEVLGVGVVVTDATERRRAERRAAAQQSVNRVLAEAESLGAAIPLILEAVCRSLGWRMGAMWAVEPIPNLIHCVDLWRAPGDAGAEFEELTRSRPFPPGVGLPGRVWATGEPAWIPDVGKDPNFPRGAAAVREGLHGAFGFPVVSGGRVLGVLEFFSDRILRPDEDLLGMMAIVGGQIGQFVERKKAEDAVRDSEARKSAILQAAFDSIIAMDSTGRITDFNPAAERTFGYSREEAVGRRVADVLVPPALRARHVEGLRRYLATGEPAILGRRVEMTAMRRDGTEFPVEVVITRVNLPGRPLFKGSIRDITERKRAEEERAALLAAERAARQEAEDAGRRVRFLLEASTALTSSLDYLESFQALGRVAVQGLADLCLIDLLEEDGGISRMVAAHADPARAELAARLLASPPDPAGRHPVATVIRTGRSSFSSDMTEEFLRNTSRDEEHYRVIRQLEFRSYVSVPLMARGRVLGAITLVSTGRGRRFDRADLALAEDLAGRAALALDNARLYRERDYVARTLQHSLLPPGVPDIPGAEVAARYLAAGEGNEVGGDFYDVFAMAGGSWGLVIGDVRGKGAGAAAVMGLVRHTIRAAAMQEREPSRILTIVNDAMMQQATEERFATVAFVRLDPRDGGAGLTVCVGGHPLPRIVRAGGRVEAVGTPGVLLGLFAEPPLTDHRSVLSEGETLVLYTDGVTEERSDAGFFGDLRLDRVLADVAGLDAAAAAERLEDEVLRFVSGPPRDDIAILLLRLVPGGR